MTNLYSNTLTGDNDAWNGYTVVVRLPASVLTLPSFDIVRLRVRLEAGSTQACTFSKAYVGHRAGSGDAYDFSTTPVQLLFSGGASGVASAGSTVTSDWANFAYDKTSDLLFAFYLGGGTSSDMTRQKNPVTSVDSYYTNADEAATVNKSAGYTTQATNFLHAVNLVEVEGFSGGVIMF